MRISKEKGGAADSRDVPGTQGRGEYEWCALTEFDPQVHELLDCRIFINLPDGRSIDTGCVFTTQGDEQRIRTAEGVNPREVYPIWHAAAVLLLPRPNRDQNSWGGGVPVMRNGQYGITHLHLGRVTIPQSGRAETEIDRVEIANTYAEEMIAFAERYRDVQRVWAERGQFEQEIYDLIAEHEELTHQGQPSFGTQAGRIVVALQTAIAASAADYDILGTAATTDVLPVLLQIINRTPTQPPPLPAAIPPEEAAIRRRDVNEWRRWAAARGAASVRFRRLVRQAYNFTCVVCGLRLPSFGNGTNPGVDAAHILPWAEFDLDEVRNGLCLCKLHHWAFDEGLLEIRHDAGRYFLAVSAEAEQRIRDSSVEMNLEFLRGFEGEIAVTRLPSAVEDRPHPAYLARLREELYG